MTGENTLASMDLTIDRAFVSRLLLGALSEHEQRMLVARLARRDSNFRASLSSILESFELLDGDLALEYSAALDSNPDQGDRVRREILSRSDVRMDDLETVLDELTIDDTLALGEVTRKLFSWSMAELLLQRSLATATEHRARTSLYLASMVIDVVEILGATGRSPDVANVISDLRRRIGQAAESIRPA